MKEKEFRVPIRGQVLALFGRDEILTIATTHPEGTALPLYHVNLSTGEWKLTDLAFPLQVITAGEESGILYAAGTDNNLYNIEGNKIRLLNLDAETTGKKAQGSLPAGFREKKPDEKPEEKTEEKVIDLKVRGQELFVLKKNRLEIRNPEGLLLEQIPLGKPSAFDIDPGNRWLAVGFEDGRIQAFSREEEEHFVPKESERVHQSAVSFILFDSRELHVISTAADKQIMLTQLRGKLDITERSGKGQDGAVYSLIPGPENTFFTGGDDNIKIWPGGHNRKAPFTTKVEGPVTALSFWKMGEYQVIALGKTKGMISLIPLDEKNKPQDITRKIYTIKSWCHREFESVDTRLREACLKKLTEFPDLFTVETIKERALKDTDTRLRVLAVNLLMELEHKDVDEALISLLGSKDQAVHLAAFEYLLKRKKLAPFYIVTKAIQTGHKELGLKGIPLLAAQAVSDQQAYNRLIQELGNKIYELRSAAFEALQKFHANDPVQAVILGLNASEQDIRVQAMKYGYQRQLLQNREFLRLIRRHLDDSSMEVRYSAFILSLLTQPLLAGILRALDEDIRRRLHDMDGKKPNKIDPERLPELNETERTPLIEAMATPALDICLAGAKALALLKDARAFGVLLQLSRESSEETRIAVCQAFSSLGDSNAIPRLRLLLHDEKINVADAAFTALGKLLKEETHLLLEAGLDAPDKKIRIQAMAVLARLLKKEPGKQENLAFMEKALNDNDTAVRREAFKTLLNADLKLDRAAVLRFALRSAHSDIRREVVMELDSRKKESWAQEVLGSMLNDTDPSIRGECFALLRRSAGESPEVFMQALGSEYEDVRSTALELLLKGKKKEEAVLDMVCTCLEDRSPQIRRKALDGLIAGQHMQRLEQALQSAFADVRVRVASAQAAYGIKSALPPLLEMIRAEEPKDKNEQGGWMKTVNEAIGGICLLGEAEAFNDLRALIENPKGSCGTALAKSAVTALRFVAREEHKEALARLFTIPDKTIKQQIGLAMAAVGDPRGASEVFSTKNIYSLTAALRLRHVSREPLYSFMDEKERTLRSQALLLCLFTDLTEETVSPAGCLAGLAAAHLDIRLQAAGAMENFTDSGKFLAFVTAYCNQRFNPAWEVKEQTVEELALLISLGPHYAAMAVTEYFLGYTPSSKQEDFDCWWFIISNRYAQELRALKAGLKAGKKTGTGALLPLAIGTYVGILRLKDSSVRVTDRLGALNRLAGIAAEIPGHKESIATCLKVALHDNSAEVRNKAFEHLLKVSPVEELAAEAIATENRDIARKAMNLLLEQGKPEETEVLLKDIQLCFTNGLEEEANDVLVKQYGLVSANTAALGARSPALRSLGITALSHLYEKEETARQALHSALKSDFKDVRQKAAFFLSSVRDEAAMPLLREMLFSSEKKEVEQAVRGYQNLHLPGAVPVMLECLEKTPQHPQAKTMLKAVGELADGDGGRGALKLLAGYPQLRGDIYQALVKISGYDQELMIEKTGSHEDTAGCKVVVNTGRSQPYGKETSTQTRLQSRAAGGVCDQPRTLDNELLELLLKNLTELGESTLLTKLIPLAAYCLLPEVDKDLASLSKFKDQGVREAALSAAALRLREFKSLAASGAATLREGLGHSEVNSKFLAAEGLALAGYDDGLQVLLTGADMLANTGYRERAVLALGKLANPRALDYLLRLVENEEHPLREAAVEAAGYMKETDQASRIFELLKKFVRAGRQGLVLRALKGLRWFNSPEGWHIIRDTALGSSQFQIPAIELLSADSDGNAAMEALRKLIRSAVNFNIVRKTCEVLIRLSEPDSLEAYYEFLLSPAPAAVRNAVPEYLERLCEEGEASRLLKCLGEIQDRELFREISIAILKRTPLPVQEALALLPQAAPRVCEFILQILGRSRHPLPEGELEALTVRYWSLWKEDIAEGKAGTGEGKKSISAPGAVLERLAWLGGVLSVFPPSFRVILENNLPGSRHIRGAILQALLDRKPGTPLAEGFLPALKQLAIQGEKELRPLAVLLLHQAVPGESAALYPGWINTPRALTGLDLKEQALKQPQLLSRTLELGLLSGQLTREDIPALEQWLTETSLEPKTLQALLEVLGNMLCEEAEGILENFARGYKKGKAEDTDLGKYARKLVRRIKERRRRQELQADRQWMEVTG